MLTRGFRFCCSFDSPHGLATLHIDREEHGVTTIEIVRVKITDLGRRAL